MNKPNLIAFISALVVIPVIAYATQVKVNSPGGMTGPGSVPIGGMVAVMPNTHANAWQPPASGQIKDGFMRADGGTVPTCSDCVIPAGQVLPNMNGSFPKGATTSGTLTAAQKLAGSHIPQLSTSYTPAGTVGVTISGSAPSLTGTTSFASTAHTHSGASLAAYIDAQGTTLHISRRSISSWTADVYANLNFGATTASGLIWGAGIVGDTGAPNGATPTASVGIANGSYSISGTSFTGTAATITVGTAVGSQTVLPDPANVTVVWVIRVK